MKDIKNKSISEREEGNKTSFTEEKKLIPFKHFYINSFRKK